MFAAKKGHVHAMNNWTCLNADSENETALNLIHSAVKKEQYEASYKYADLPVYLELLNKADTITRYMKYAAKHSQLDAMYAYAFILLFGDGVSIDKKKTNFNFKFLADKGNVSAMLNFAIKEFITDDIQCEQSKIFRYLEKAMNNGLCIAREVYYNITGRLNDS